jgi:hypothetical protein
MKRVVLLAVLCFLTSLAGGAAAAQDADSFSHFEEGLRQARAENFPAAVTHFEAALRDEPTSPLLLYNLALAEAEIPGRELRAICWLGAFLAARPDSAAKEDVIAQIEVLRRLSRENIERLIALYTNAGNQVPDDRLEYKESVTFKTAALWLQAEDDERARNLLAEIDPSSDRYERLERALAGNTILRNQIVSTKTDDESLAYRVEWPNARPSSWDRVLAWLSRATGGMTAGDEALAAAWVKSCSGYAMSQPLFTDQFNYLRALANNYASRAEWADSNGLSIDISTATAEITYVHTSKSFEIERLIAWVETPWIALSALALILGGHVILGLGVLFFARTELSSLPASTSDKWRALGATFLFWLPLTAAAIYFGGDSPDAFANADIVPALIGGALLLMLVVASLASWGSLVFSIKSLFTSRRLAS